MQPLQESTPCHIHIYIALYELALEEFFMDMPHLKKICLELTKEIIEACTILTTDANEGSQCTKTANISLLQVLTNEGVIEQLKKWEYEKSSNAVFKAMFNYLHWVETILFFIEASRNADLALHLQAGEELSKLFSPWIE